MHITIVSVVAIVFMMVILLHKNPFANPGDELIKKCIAAVIIMVSLVLYAVLYEKIIVLPEHRMDLRPVRAPAPLAPVAGNRRKILFKN